MAADCGTMLVEVFSMGHKMDGKKLHDRFVERFATKSVPAANGCIEWTSAKNHFGYGQVKYKGAMKQAHRVAWELKYGEIPDNLCVLHKCDNPSCVNTDHLFLGTRNDNAKDRQHKGRGNSRRNTGEINHFSVLSEDDVVAIRSQPNYRGLSVTLARKYGVTPGAIRMIQRRQTWIHVT